MTAECTAHDMLEKAHRCTNHGSGDLLDLPFARGFTVSMGSRPCTRHVAVPIDFVIRPVVRGHIHRPWACLLPFDWTDSSGCFPGTGPDREAEPMRI